MIYSIIRYKVDEYHKLKYKSEKVIQKTNYGPVMGFKMPCTDYGYDYYSFQGIPYAKPPVGPLRFKASIHFVILQSFQFNAIFFLVRLFQIDFFTFCSFFFCVWLFN